VDTREKEAVSRGERSSLVNSVRDYSYLYETSSTFRHQTLVVERLAVIVDSEQATNSPSRCFALVTRCSQSDHTKEMITSFNVEIQCYEQVSVRDSDEGV
jgi:hypothetical protein